jgi:hypothetical protein
MADDLAALDDPLSDRQLALTFLSGFVVFLGDDLVSWSSKRQHTVSRSSAEDEYRTIANGVAEACWLRQLLQELQEPLRHATIVYCDNVNVVYLSTNPVQHQRTKSMLRSISTLSMSGWLLGTFVSFMLPLPSSMPTYSQRAFLHRCFWIFTAT